MILSEKTDTMHLEFEVPELERFDFTAGQFISMVDQHDGKTITRAYSLASPPRGNNRFDLCLNRVEHGYFSNLLCDMEEGDQVRFHGPHGYFVLRNPVRDAVFIATGTGIAPMRGMLEWLFAEKGRSEGHRFWLVFGTRYESDIYYQEEFARMAAENPNFQYLITVSRPGSSWTGLTGWVQEHVRAIAAGRADMDAYICGLANMVKANRTLLIEELGWDKKSVIFERFD